LFVCLVIFFPLLQLMLTCLLSKNEEREFFSVVHVLGY